MANLRPPLLAALAAALASPGLPPPDAAARGFDFEKGWGTRGAASADLDGDGAPDLLLAQAWLDYGPQKGRVVAFLGDPASPGRWRSRAEVAVGANPLDIVVADLDGDGRPDVATAGAHEGTVTVLLQQPGGGFDRADYPGAAGGRGIAAGDLDRDGRPDLAVAGSRDAVVLFQDGNAPGAFLPPALVAGGVEAACLAVADIDGVSGNDLVLGLFDSLRILPQDAAVPGDFPVSVPVDAPGRDLERLVAADLDGNGRVDLALAMRGDPYGGPGKGLGILLQGAGGGLAFTTEVVDPGQPLKTIEARDMDGDGVPDLLTSGGGRVLWYRQDPAEPGTFRREGKKGLPASEGGIAGADFDGDGRGDAAVSFYRPYLLLQKANGKGGFRTPSPYRESPP